MSLYGDVISSYSRNAPNNFEMTDSTISYNEESRLCWDKIKVFLKIGDWKIEDFSFIWNTSIITKACASIFGESIIWEPLQNILVLDSRYITDLVWEISPRRKHASALWLLATRNAIHKFLEDGKTDSFDDVLK